MSILDDIVAAKRRRLERGEYGPLGKPAPRGDGAAFVASLSAPGVRIVAEIKGCSPSAGEILRGADGRVETMALAYRRGHAAALSVVIEEDFFCGRPDWLPRAKRIAGLPALMKDFVVSERQLDFAVSLGADAVLLIARALSDVELSSLAMAARDRRLATVVEAHDADEIRRAASCGPDVLGVNARDLSTFETSLEALAALGPCLPEGPVRLAESGIRTPADVARLRQAGFQAFLVGESLLRHEEPEQLLRELRS
jgi:indole-3-glycerol phosphate synthase